MISFVDKLYISDNIISKVDKIKLNTISGKGILNAYFITLANSKNDIFDIYSANVFRQRDLRKSDMVIIGIAESYDSATLLVQDMINECLKKGVDVAQIRNYYEGYIKEHT